MQVLRPDRGESRDAMLMERLRADMKKDERAGAAALPTRDILGIPVQVATNAQAVRLLDDHFESGSPTRVAFLNANNSNLAADQPRLAEAFRTSLVFNDGIGLDLASRALYGSAFPENVNGTDFNPLFLRATRHRLRVYLLGGHPGVPEKVAEEFRRVAPQHDYVGCRNGFFKPDEIPAIAGEMVRLRADVLLVALGTPLQEYWLADHFAATGCRLGIAVGGLFDFASGNKPRAPLWIRRIQMEWVYRLLLEPRRMWRRYILGNARFLARVARAALTRKRAS